MIHNRFQILDMARGMAIMLMVAFHFCYNLEYFQVIEINIKEELFWTSLRNFIVFTFIFIAGISLYLSSAKRPDFISHLKRQKWLFVCALLVSAATYPVFPESWIYFGVLHFILAARIMGFVFTRLYLVNLVFGILILWMGVSLESEFFNPRWINWIGFTTYKPFTEDYVPVFPWFGVILLGMFTGRQFFGRKKTPDLLKTDYSSHPAIFLSLAGQNSLIIYMIHQPILMGLIYSGLIIL